jgi:hypothetical protein
LPAKAALVPTREPWTWVSSYWIITYDHFQSATLLYMYIFRSMVCTRLPVFAFFVGCTCKSHTRTIISLGIPFLHFCNKRLVIWYITL